MKAKEFIKESPTEDMIDHVVKLRYGEMDGDSEYAEIAYENDIDNWEDEDEEDYKEITDEMIAQHHRYQVEDAFYMFKELAKGNHIEAWRVISVPKDIDLEELKKTHVGIYWSYEKNAAEAHWGKFDGKHMNIRIHANLPITSIDWIGTLLNGSNPIYEEEKEIRIKENAPYTLLGIEKLAR